LLTAGLITLTLFASVSIAHPALSPTVKVKTELSEALSILHDRKMPEVQRRLALKRLAESDLDLSWMAQAALGEHWREIDDAERKEFVALFTAFIEEAYLSQIQDYAELNIKIEGTRQPRPDYADVDGIVIQPHEEDMPITFKLERRGNDWLVYDIEVEGVSMVHNYGEQFDRVIRQQGMPQLLKDLRAKQKELARLIGKS